MLSSPRPHRPRTVRIRDGALHAAVKRLEGHSQLLVEQVDTVEKAGDAGRVDATVALLHAELTAKLVRAAVYEVALRLVPHQVPFDAERQLRRRLGPFERAKMTFESLYGPVAEA